MKRIYLDYNATTPLREIVASKLLESFSLLGNASSVHSHGRGVRQVIEEARHFIASYFHREPADVVFTSGATEANNFAVKGFNGSVIISAIEHDSVLRANPKAMICQVNQEGVIDLNHLETLLKSQQQPTLVSVMAANNETGVIQPLKDVVNLVRHYGAYIHVDAVQAVGKLSLDWSDLNLDLISISAHKIGGPAGIGVLIIRPQIQLTPSFTGGGQERSYRPGTENLLGILGLASALEACQDDDWTTISLLRDELESRLINLNYGVKIFGSKAPRLPNTSNILMPGVRNNLQVMDFDLNGISISAGSACSSGKVKASHVLAAMNVPSSESDQSIRLSLGWQTTATDLDTFFKCWVRLYERTHPSLVQRIA